MRIKRLLRAGFKYVTSADYRFLINATRGMYDSQPDEDYLRRKFCAILGYELNLDDPKTFNEKLQWLKLYDRRPEYSIFVDKYRVRDHVAKTIGAEYLIPLLGVWSDPDEIELEHLPEQFVLKCNHNSGLGMCICRDKSALNWPKTKQMLKKGLAQDYYLTGREWPYKNVERKIIAEKYMVDESGWELKDYKVMCFNGQPRLIQMHSGRFSQQKQDFYDVDWTLTDIEQTIPRTGISVERPAFLAQMLELSAKLSEGIPQVRVDWYFAENQLFFGELTFFDGSGFERFLNYEWDLMLGSWIKLPERRNGYG